MPHCIRKMLAWHNSIYRPANGFEPVARLSAAQAGGCGLQRMLGTGDNIVLSIRRQGGKERRVSGHADH